MRGARNTDYVEYQFEGIIPAYAGSTGNWRLGVRQHRDHPRVCGEHRIYSRSKNAAWGSSPRMRGALRFDIRHNIIHGIIPAYAGSTLIKANGLCFIRDHPRVCGEHAMNKSFEAANSGSSPRMRGALFGLSGFENGLGIIPAYAGSTALPPKPFTPDRDHPRVCGEHLITHGKGKNLPGSSPRMRGALLRRHDGPCHEGIIPAYAGSTLLISMSIPNWWDHPRVCGEHRFQAFALLFGAGSSPRMRGALIIFLHRRRQKGIIPAYAGSTGCRWQRAARSWDHPRVCGEHRCATSRKT